MNASGEKLSTEVKRLALAAGFDLAGIVRPEILAEGDPFVEAWAAYGRHGGMAWFENYRARREHFLKGCGEIKSVIVLGVHYRKQARSEKPPAGAGRIAVYAQGLDYHEVIARRHSVLIERLKKCLAPASRFVSCVDAQPLPERRTAAAAGLGWIGKNTLLLNERFGPWLLLSEILTDAGLEPDAPVRGDCGDCDLCVKACPTGALDGGRGMDAHRCIAYLTVEHKGTVPRDLRPLAGDRVFGCDECLLACPRGEKAPAAFWKELEPESGTGEWLGLSGIFGLGSNADCQKKFAGTALARPNRRQWARNACLAAGNSGAQGHLACLEKALKDEAPLVRSHAAWALGRLGTEAARGLLSGRKDAEKDPCVAEEIARALAASAV